MTLKPVSIENYKVKRRKMESYEWENNYAVKRMYDRLMLVAVSVFEWKNLPDSIDEIYLENLVSRCENEIDKMSLELPPLRIFIVPGGSENISRAHVCRSVARRSERMVWTLDKTYTPIGTFLNRLSDYFFTLSRYINHQEKGTENKWLKRDER